MPTHVLGLSCFYHDSAAALLRDGEVVAACQEERLSRKKHDSGFPSRAVKYVLKEAGIGPADLDAVGFYDKPLLKFERMLSTYVATFPRSFGSFRKAMPLWIHEKLWMPSLIRKELRPYKGPILFAEHHMSHAASAFLVSPFEEAAILTVDGVGEWATASFGVGRGTDITLFKEIRFPHSLGLLYSAFTYYLGFKVNSAEYKVMGLAPYGKPVHYDRIMSDIVHLNEDGSFKLNMKYFSYDYGLRMTNGAFDDFFGGPPRKPETWMNEREFDIAASVQKVCEEIAQYLEANGIPHRRLPRAELLSTTARLISEGNVIGWFQGRMEFGPRALGGRSILADPRDPKMRDTLNIKIKFREGFRPFAPSVLEDKAAEWFDIDCESPYLLLVAQVREGKRVIPSVTHVDNSARLQTVTREQNALYYDLIAEFEKITGVPIVINTSFNVRGEPIVCTPHDAYLCFMRTNMDQLVLGTFLLEKKEQPPLREDVDWRTQYELD